MAIQDNISDLLTRELSNARLKSYSGAQLKAFCNDLTTPQADALADAIRSNSSGRLGDLILNGVKTKVKAQAQIDVSAVLADGVIAVAELQALIP